MSVKCTIKPFFLVFVLMMMCLQAWSTHNRAGEIVYRYIGNGSTLTYEFKIITYTKYSGTSVDADRDTLDIDYGDGTIEPIERTSKILIEGNENDETDIYKNEYVGVHTYPGPFTYVVSFSDPNRVDDIINIGTSVDIPFSVSDTIKILDPTLFGLNNSPQLLQPPIDNAAIGIPFVHNPNAFDPDGDSLHYSLIVPTQAPGIVVPGYAFPDQISPGPNNVITINQATGEITWDAPRQVGLYNIAILIREFRNGRCMGTLVRDMQIRVEDTPNTPPIIEGPLEICIVAGDTLEFIVTAFDNDNPMQLVELTAAGSPFIVPVSPAVFINPPRGNPVDGDFYWETVCEHLRANNYQVIFRAEDSFSDFPLSSILTTVIRVLAPPPENLIGSYNGLLDAVELDWADSYKCGDSPLFRGYQVWRKVGCEGDPQDSCATDLASRGYILLSETMSTSYIDFDFVRGNEYSYRLVARFAELSTVGNIEINPFTGYPSDEFCIEFPKEIPVMYNADVEVTDATNGEIFVAWSTPRPEDLDSFILVNPGPYSFVLKRAEGIGNTTGGITIETFTEDNLVDLMDTTFLDVGLNTIDNAYTYWIEFFVRGDDLLGSSAPASSVRLSISARNLALSISWNYDVPWLNDTFVVFRQDFEMGSFNPIDTVLGNLNNYRYSYRDDPLKNDSTYCYVVEAIGGYTADGFKEPLINFSQELCAVPNDTIAPCDVDLVINNFCLDDSLDADQYINYLTWTFPEDCPQTDDVLFYYVYFSPTQAGELVIIDTVTEMKYNHIREDSTLTGCYAIQGEDEAGNLGEIPERSCVEDCADYELPNAFTPNQDGQNDLYTPILPYKSVVKIDIKIFNRWGDLVFESEDPDINWDGSDMKSGKELDTGVFYYNCKLFINSLEGIKEVETPLEGYIHLYR